MGTKSCQRQTTTLAGSAVQQSRLSDELWVLHYKEGGVVSLKVGL